MAPGRELELTLVAPADEPRLARAPASDAAAARRVDVAEPAGEWDPETFIGTADPCGPTSGHPWNATSALASTNTSAATARSDPALPKPAMYARVARMPSVGLLPETPEP